MALQSSLRPNALLVISAPLLLLLTGSSPSVQSKLIPRSFSRAQIIKALTLGVAFGLGAQISSILSSWAEANWLWGRGRGPEVDADGWDKQVAVVTGGSSGIGSLIVKGLAAKGIKVAILDIVEPADEDIDNVHYFSCDITSPAAVKDAASAVRSFLGVPTILVNNAGIAYAHTILDTRPADLRKLFDVNLLSQFYTIQAFLPEMIKRKEGHIVTIASMSSFVSFAELTDYSATKAGVLALHEGLKQELKHRYDAPEIKTTVVHPTYVNTKLVNPYRASLEKEKSQVLEPETVANAVVNQILSGHGGQIFLTKLVVAALITERVSMLGTGIIEGFRKRGYCWGNEGELSDLQNNMRKFMFPTFTTFPILVAAATLRC